jgi:hypothetical protein
VGEHDPITVTCHLCPEGDGQIVTTWPRSWYAAMDHALDHHLAQLIAAPGDTQRSFTVNRLGRPRRLAPGPQLRRR